LETQANLFPNGPPTVIVEPGRAITSNTQVLLLSVRVMKLRKPPIAILDGGKMNITFPTAFEYHEVLAANKMREPADCNYRLVGRTCTPSDVVYDNKRLPALAEGDVIAVMDAGAYFTSFSSDFAFPRPSVVLADSGKETLLRERETFEGMVARDIST
jgi:diaminopimelate decarboxylase